MRLFLLYILSSCLLAETKSALVISVGDSEMYAAISHLKERHWDLNESVCLGNDPGYQGADASCGYVIITATNGAVIGFLEAPDGLEVGRTVVPNKNPSPNSAVIASNIKRASDTKHWQEMIGYHKILFSR